MIKFKKALTTGITLLATTMLVACGSSSSSSSSSSTDSSKNDAAKSSLKFKTATKKGNTMGGTLNVAEINDTPFTALWLPEIQTSAIDADIMRWSYEPLFKTDEHFNFVDGGPADIKLDNKAKTATITLNPKLKWSDGEKVVAKDIEYPYEMVANKDTITERYNDQYENIEGVKEYHEGKAKTISGITYPNGENGDSVVLHFKEMKPGMDVSGNGWFWENAEPYHYLKDVAFKDLKSSKKNNTNPVFYGPYKVDNIVSGQSVTFVPNKYYYQGTPHLKKVTVSIVSPATLAQQIKAHKYDLIDVKSSVWDNVKNTKGYDFLGVKPLEYSYMAFRVGKFDKDKGTIVQDPNAKMGNEKLRQAMAYAMNVDQVVEKFSHGLGYRDTTLVPTGFGEFHDSKAKGFPYNPTKAKKLLDEAGYKMGKDGYRTDPKGKKLVITLSAMSGKPEQQSIMDNYIQKWKDVGLHVKLMNGKLTEFNSFYDNLTKDAKGFDIFMAAWSLSTEPSNAATMWSANQPMNYGRFNSAKNNQLIKDVQSEKSITDHDYFVNAMIKWQDNMNKEAYIIPIDRAYKVTALNSKVENYSQKLADQQNATMNYYKIGISK
ncbi:oligopeptide ABC transporter substrate-binding protein [Xylocopilactobacillus apis]|uniref:Peptide ABC transporter substrate-binding protein n=1 Tax=Xylocopilactobacillus apis TaxID=2932183 RepID=A0AAU9D5L1_9LACO|nr:oligopeptide ABC transporter substrate-binding protein [Xylocopilactobacillus apis]BDR56102.1 peptide ABC transporter substrate-binding protein [Xylocopilactobacillus apis]